MKKQKIKDENLFRPPLCETTFRAVGTDNFVASLSRFLQENYEGAFKLDIVGHFDGFVHILPQGTAKYLTSVFRTVALSSLMEIGISGSSDALSIKISFPDTVKVDRETAREWVKLAEESGLMIYMNTDAKRVVLQATARVYVFTAEVRATTALADFYEALCDAEKMATT